jgi:hypothetical protein
MNKHSLAPTLSNHAAISWLSASIWLISWSLWSFPVQVVSGRGPGPGLTGSSTTLNVSRTWGKKLITSIIPWLTLAYLCFVIDLNGIFCTFQVICLLNWVCKHCVFIEFGQWASNRDLLSSKPRMNNVCQVTILSWWWIK